MAIVTLGALVFLAGLTFALQGYGLVGPESSMMFRNATWIYAGTTTLIVGLLLIVVAFLLVGRRKAVAMDSTPANSS